MVGVAGFEPATLWSQTRCATRLRYTPSDVLIQYLLIISNIKITKLKVFLLKSDIKTMIIQCINCNKKFEVNSDLIPSEGRNIQCGSCNHLWFFKKKTNTLKISKMKNKIICFK